MRRDFFAGPAIALAVVAATLARQPAQPPAASAPQTTTPSVPAIITPPKSIIPEGFTSIFNGENLTGWHVSSTNHHGTTPDYRVVHGVIVGTQSPLGRGGILLTDRKYKNVELYVEVRPDYGCDSGLFLRSSEAGEAYQVTMDYLPGGGMGGIYGERLEGVGGPRRWRGPARSWRRQSRWRRSRPARSPGPAARRRRHSAREQHAAGRGRVDEGLEARGLERGARPYCRGHPAHHGVDQRSADHGFHRHGEPREGRHHRRTARHPGPRWHALGAWRVLALADDRGEGAPGRREISARPNFVVKGFTTRPREVRDS